MTQCNVSRVVNLGLYLLNFKAFKEPDDWYIKP